MNLPTWSKWAVVLILLMTTIVVPLVLFDSGSSQALDRVLEWSEQRPIATAAVLIGALAADVFLPVPNGVINTLAGSLFGLVMGSLVIWLGLSLGCITGYMAGKFAGQPLVRRFVGVSDLAEAERFAMRRAAPALVITRAVPMFGDLSTIAAGMAGYPFGRYMAVVSLANVGVAVVFAGIGSVATESESELLAILGAIVLPALAWLGYRLAAGSKRSS